MGLHVEKNAEFVFAYGTLKQGHFNHTVLERQSAVFVDRGTIDGYIMYDLGAFPALVPSEDGQQIVGEVYKVPNLILTDMLEGYPHFYDRVEETVICESGEVVRAWVYFMHEIFSETTKVVNGAW